MALRTFVKVGSITNLSDARYCAGMGADLLGFRAVPGHDNHITPKQFQEIRGWVTGPQIVAEVYGLPDIAAWSGIQEEYRPDMIELGLQELAVLSREPSLPYILALAPGEQVPADRHPTYVLIDPDNPALLQLATKYPVLVTVQQTSLVQSLLDGGGIRGLALQGGQEDRPGLREYNELGEILEMLDTD
jgi:phosphoribosylanthranilate isomerase